MKSKTSFSRQASSLKRRSRGSSAITGVGIGAHHPPRGVLPERQVVLPEAELRLHQPGRVGHQPRGHLHEGAADVQRVGRASDSAWRFRKSVTIRCPRSATSDMVRVTSAGSGSRKCGWSGVFSWSMRHPTATAGCLQPGPIHILNRA